MIALDSKLVTLQSAKGGCSVSIIPEQGAVVASIMVETQSGPRELLYRSPEFGQADLTDLAGGMPFCFPICGRLDCHGRAGVYQYDNQDYAMPIHGFARNMAWNMVGDVVDQQADQIILELSSNPKTLSMYPWQFKLQLIYSVLETGLHVSVKIVNLDEKPMPLYPGFHPYFLMPEKLTSKDKCLLNFTPEKQFIYNSSLTELVGEKSVCEFPQSIMNPEANEQLFMGGNSVELIFEDKSRIVIEKNDNNLLKYWQTYTDEARQFFCVEPWMGYPNLLNHLDQAPCLLAGQALESAFTVRFKKSQLDSMQL